MNKPIFHLRAPPAAKSRSVKNSLDEIMITAIVVLLIGWVVFLFFNAGLILLGRDQREFSAAVPQITPLPQTTIVSPVTDSPEEVSISKAVTPPAVSVPARTPVPAKTPAAKKRG